MKSTTPRPALKVSLLPDAKPEYRWRKFLNLMWLPYAPSFVSLCLTRIAPGSVYAFRVREGEYIARDATWDYRKTNHKQGIRARSVVYGQWCFSWNTYE